MSLIIAFLFPFLAITYILFVHKNDFGIAPYISGIISGVCIIPLCITFKLNFYTNPSFFWYSFSYFFSYFFLPSVSGLVLYFVFNIKNFEPKTTPMALSGILTIYLFLLAYDFATLPVNSIYFILLITYISSILFFDLLVTLFQMFPKWLVLMLGYVLTLPFAFFSMFSFALWLYKYSPLFYLLPLSLSSLIFLVIIIIIKLKQKNISNEAIEYVL